MPLRTPTTIALICGLALGVALSMTARVLASRGDATAPVATAASTASLQSAYLREIVERVEHDYVRPVAEQTLLDNAVRGMVGSLDPYSAYLDQRQYEDMRAITSGQYPGVGVEIEAAAAGLKVLRAIEDSPAARAGVLAGDVIIRIADRAIGTDADAAVERLRGPPGSQVKLTLLRAGRAQSFDVTLQRTQVALHTVTHTVLEPGFGYLRIASFSNRTAQDAQNALEQLQTGAAGRLRGLVLDLRNNPGGVLEAAVAVADLFLDSGVIVSANGRTAEARFRMDATPGDALNGAPMIVLVDGGSASAAEILAGALHDNRRATLIGRRTFGKGSVQTLIPLSDGRALKLTTSLYFTPSGASIHEHGIEPDVQLVGASQPPLDITGTQDVPLQARDGEVTLALERLRAAALGSAATFGRSASAGGTAVHKG